MTAGPVLPPPAPDAPLPAPIEHDGFRTRFGVPYEVRPGQRPLELDLHVPIRSSGPVPLVVFLHGGGWRTGSRHGVGPMFADAPMAPFAAWTAAGIAVASVDYRLSGEAVWPAQRDDVASALTWLCTRADELGIDPDRIGVWGESAGGHLAAIAALADPALLAAVCWYPPTDLLAMAAALGQDPDAADTREAQLLGGALAARPELARDASPVSHVHPDAPPFLILHGEADRLVPADQGRALHRALTGVGARSTLHTYPDVDHMWLGAPDTAADALARTVSFVADRL